MEEMVDIIEDMIVDLADELTHAQTIEGREEIRFAQRHLVSALAGIAEALVAEERWADPKRALIEMGVPV